MKTLKRALAFVTAGVLLLLLLTQCAPQPSGAPETADGVTEALTAEENPGAEPAEGEPETDEAGGLSFLLNEDGKSYSVYKGTCDETDIVIPPTYKGKPVTVIGKNAFSYSYGNLISVVIPDSVKVIGENAFCACTGLTDVTLGTGVTCIEENAFFQCENLKSILIPDSVTEIGEKAFSACKSLVSVSIGKGVTVIGTGVFADCAALPEVTIPDSVTRIGEKAFSGCSRLARITVPDGLTRIEANAFSGTGYVNGKGNRENGVLYLGCHLIVAEPSFSGTCAIREGTSCIADYAFKACAGLTEVTIPDSVTYIGE